MHEFIHTLGFTHMQNHVNRDTFVKIYYDRIIQSAKYNFEKVNVQEYGNFETPYDFASVMHYGKDAFAKVPGEITIEPVNKIYANVMGQRKKLSPGDIKRINYMYQCPGYKN